MSNSHAAEPGTERTLRSSTRTNPRRRQRQSDNDTLPTKAPKRRRRNKVEEETFEARDSTEDASTQSQTQPAPEHNIALTNGHIHPTAEKHSVKGTPTLDGTMTIRGRVKRALRGDNATVLAHNQCYTVKLLPSTPKELRKEGVEYRGSLGPHHLALAVTRQKALIWECNAHTAASNPRTFDVPFASKAGEPLPFGALISNNVGSTDYGLLLISAATGAVVFYESIDRAASLGVFQGRKAGVEGSIGNLFSGETVAELVSAAHAGFVVVLSSGRLAQLTLRDSQGKPKIWSQFLRVTEPNSGGLFGSFSSFWNGGFRKDVTAVHTRPLNARGQMQAITLTERGEVLIWDLEWSGRADFKASIQFDEVLSNELKQVPAPEIAGMADKLTTLDFAILDKPDSNEVATVGAEQPLSIAVLVRVGTHDMHNYVLAELSLLEDRVLVGRVTQLSGYEGRGDVRYQAKPRLVLPKPGHTVYVTFEDATILVDARDSASDNPDAQLHEESYIEPDVYEETIYLRQDKDLAMQGVFEEEAKSNQSSCLAFIKSAGLVRISATDVRTIPEGWKIPAKSRIEQGVFYGSLQVDNILDFSRRKPSRFTVDEVARAALVVSEEILNAETSFTNFISPSPTSMEQHLATKAKALRALVTFVRQNYPALSRSTMWQLLWNAERVAIGQQLWIAFEEHVAMSSDKGKRKATLLDEMCSWFEEDQKHNSFVTRPELKDEEPVRKFFIAGLHRLEQLLSNVRVYLKSLEDDDNNLSSKVILRLVVQANDVWLKTFETAFAFRAEHCSDYGILSELIEDGILIDSAEYADIPEFWTSTKPLIDQTALIASLSRHFANKFYENNGEGSEPDNLLQELAENNPRLVQVYCSQFQECINWRMSRPSQKDQQLATRLQAEYEQGRYEQCRQVAEVGQAERGMEIAEKYRDMNTLTDMIIAEDQFLEEEQHARSDPAGVAIIVNTRAVLGGKVRRYFERYGTLWADAFFDKLFSSVHVGRKLEVAQEKWGPALKKYLRSHPDRAKICWINDVTKENDYAHASKALAQAANDYESRLWAKKVELSMSTLALLAAEEADGRSEATKLSRDLPVNDPRRSLVVIDIQSRIYEHMSQTIIHSLDPPSIIENCMSAYGKHVADHPALRRLLESNIRILCDHAVLEAEQLIDTLTLIDLEQDFSHEGNLQGTEFVQALTVLEMSAARLTTERFETLLKMIWKRCYVYDDWATQVSLSGKKSDQERKAAIRATATWITLYHFAKSELLTTSNAIRILTPSECLGAGCSPQDLSYRFADEEFLDGLLHDFKIQDEQLQLFVQDRNLDEIAQECRRDAEAYVAEEKLREQGNKREKKPYWYHGSGFVLDGFDMNGKAVSVAYGNHLDLEDADDDEESEDEDGDTEMGEYGEDGEVEDVEEMEA
ncbi:hypothetical protein M409DRAFT_30896 [Zasmidium cellare ATCC 36951]|uniref:Nucleoporin Nup133/Nup155-like C-terminal domain-containing protein n=1 Tax=Zasmidium cellare ATCC 36951 TaxID=1080233 RepID=A0A6A6BYX1_ZASCE|nr:uncharacterized protein M409DRAFT_30896 [Zasmidium cellare ATCC 36951]KAF2158616.1 hypothetical protein M409DRAFT_30896 [Zasmidium cellare ATCC 36951]